MFLIHTPSEHAEIVALAVVSACRQEGWHTLFNQLLGQDLDFEKIEPLSPADVAETLSTTAERQDVIKSIDLRTAVSRTHLKRGAGNLPFQEVAEQLNYRLREFRRSKPITLRFQSTLTTPRAPGGNLIDKVRGIFRGFSIKREQRISKTARGLSSRLRLIGTTGRNERIPDGY